MQGQISCHGYWLTANCKKNLVKSIVWRSDGRQTSKFVVTKGPRKYKKLKWVKGTKILQWNARSLRRKLYNLKVLARKCDIVCIQETWFEERNMDGSLLNFTLPGFEVIRKDREEDSSHGGVSIIIKKGIEFKPLSIRKFYGLEIVAIELKNKTSVHF